MSKEFESKGGEQNIAKNEDAVKNKMTFSEFKKEIKHEFIQQKFLLKEEYIKIYQEQLSIQTGENIFLSMKYLQCFLAENIRTNIITLSAITILLALNFLFQYRSLYFPLVILYIFNILLVAKIDLILYRIRKGIFGTNRTEAREMINFIIKNSDNLDFTDSNGNLRRALLPEAKDSTEEHIPGTLGEKARA